MYWNKYHPHLAQGVTDETLSEGQVKSENKVKDKHENLSSRKWLEGEEDL